MKHSLSMALIALTGALAACGSDSTGPDEELSGSFELEVSGTFNETGEGPAWFGSEVNDQGDPVFMLLLGDENSRHAVFLATEGATRPDVGTYEIGLEGWELLHIVSDDEDLLGMFMAHEGEIRITASSSTALRGEIDFVASGVFNEEEVVTGTITFDAVPAPESASGLRGVR